MERGTGREAAASLRALASPVTLLCLALLALNDHVLKQAWPGVVTGKLSDITGLVVAPPLLGLVLALARVPRPATVALLSTAVGFALTKSTETGADVASAAWTFVAGPSHVRPDPTDLLALPALLVAARVQASSRRAMPDVRRRASLAVGALALPFAVLATAATSCDSPEGIDDVVVLEGDFPGPPRRDEARIVVGVDYNTTVSIGPAADDVRLLSQRDLSRTVGWGTSLQVACDPDQLRSCWRVLSAEPPSVMVTSDGGETWHPEYEMSADDASALHEELGEGCGEPRPIRAVDVAVLATSDGPLVAVASQNAGLLLRSADGRWNLLEGEALTARAAPAPSAHPEPSGGLTPAETTPSAGPAAPVVPSLPLTCASPRLVTVTPNPSNGPPFVDERCLDGPDPQTSSTG